MLLDRMFGSFGAVALVVVLIVRWLNGHRTISELLALAIGITAFPSLFLLLGQVTDINPYIGGFLDGVWGFPISTMRLLIVLGFLLIAHFLLVYLYWRKRDELLYFLLFLLFYAELLVFYWLVIPNYGHFFQILPVLVIFGVFALRSFANGIISRTLESKILTLTLVFSVAFATYWALNLERTNIQVNKTAESHKIFTWPYEQAQIRSTMDPVLFSDAVNMIERWEKKEGAYVISQHDTLLLFLANKHHLSPHFDLVSYLSGPMALRDAVESWRELRPEFLFVDSCIECSLQTLKSSRPSLLQVNPAQYERISEKIDRLNQLKELFAVISDEYEMVERGMLVSAYRLKFKP